MGKHVLITGGAGFIGSHLADALLARGDRVRVLDNLEPQVHGEKAPSPAYLSREVELVVGDVRDPDAVHRALDGVDAVFHLAAAVGVAQSMYEVHRYTDVNNVGTAVLCQALLEKPVGKLVVASSMSLYGEGLYKKADGTLVQGRERPLERLKCHQWEPVDAEGHVLEPVPTPETKEPSNSSVYALSKHDQERLCLLIGRAYGMDAVALRFFNVYGPRQALSNPYTGALAIFASRLLNRRPPLVYEDGNQRRDFVSVHDIVQGCVLALDSEKAKGHAINIGSGKSYTVLEVARKLIEATDAHEIEPEVTKQFRVGDIRHCFADISLARELLGYEPRVSLDDGLRELAGWLVGQLARDRVGEARAELASRGLAA